jgi:flagellar basal-body rod protein FlgG
MLRALSTAATGMQAQQSKLDVTANNIANVGTSGFKKSRVEFSDLLYQTQSSAGAATSTQSKTPQAVQVGMGVRVDGTARLETQGDMKQTGDSLNLAIEGEGYFPVTLPNGETAFTRAGTFKLDAGGNMVTSAGHRLAGDVNIPPEATAIEISPNGVVMVRMPDQVELEDVGRVELATFANPGGLEAMGRTSSVRPRPPAPRRG